MKRSSKKIVHVPEYGLVDGRRVALGLSGGVDSAVSAHAPKPSLVRGKRQVAVGLSGGVDSAVSAALLKEQGYDVMGVFLVCWSGPGCRTDQDRKDALAVALKLGIPFEVLDYRKEYRERVVEYFVSEYRMGRTPNPDTVCNREIKFGLMYEWAIEERDFDYIATGHYARVQSTRELSIFNDQSPNNHQFSNFNKQTDASLDFFQPKVDQNDNLVLLRGVDAGKDQSYFLYQIKPEQLPYILFPVGGMLKSEVREKAKELGLVVAEKPDSQGICFMGEVNVRRFLKEKIEPRQGEMVVKIKNQKSNIKMTGKRPKINNGASLDSSQPEVDQNDKLSIIGEHEGVWFYTVGQRVGKGLDGKRIKEFYEAGMVDWDPRNLSPLYVVEKDVERNRLVVGEEGDLEKNEFGVREVNWLVPNFKAQMTNECDVGVRIRNLGEIVGAKIKNQNSPLRQGFEGQANLKMTKQYVKISVRTDRPLIGVAEGQACVFYSGDEPEAVVLGGGVIG